MALNRIRFLNTFINNVSLNEAIAYILKCVQEKSYIHVLTANVDQIVRIEKDEYFKNIYNSAELVLTDGTPLLWISKLFGRPIREKICGSDLVYILAEAASKRGLSIFLLGAMPGVADQAAQNLKRRYKNLKIAGTYSPLPGFEKNVKEINYINRLLFNSKADLLFVGMGVPKQDVFIYKNKGIYKIPVSISVGASIDFIAGKQKRAPKWINKIGLEWLYRLCRDPRRLFRRYVIDDSKIAGIIWKYRKQMFQPR